MKRFLFMAFLFASLPLFAQDEAGTFCVMPKVGINLAAMTDNLGVHPRIGLNIGAEASYQLSKPLALSAGVFYSQQGEHYHNFKPSTRVKLDYVNVPVLANFYVARGLALKVGVQPGFNVSHKCVMPGPSFDFEGPAYADWGDDVKSFDVAIPVGLSYDVRKLVFDARYNYGLRKSFWGWHHQVFQFTLGYKFEW